MTHQPIARCVVCDCDLYESPTERGWARLDRVRGLCWACTESFHRIMVRIQEKTKAITEGPTVAEETIRRYQACAVRLLGMYDYDPLPNTSKAHSILERLEEYLENDLLSPTPEPRED